MNRKVVIASPRSGAQIDLQMQILCRSFSLKPYCVQRVSTLKVSSSFILKKSVVSFQLIENFRLALMATQTPIRWSPLFQQN